MLNTLAGLAYLAVLPVAVLACESNAGSPSGSAQPPVSSSGASSNDAAASSRASASSGASARPSPSADPSAPPKERARAPVCKATTSGKKSEHLFTRRERTTALAIEHGTLFVATWNRNTFKGELVAADVDGSEPLVLADLGPQKAPVTSLAANATHVFFSQAGVLRRMPRGGGEVEVLSEQFGSDLSIEGKSVFGVHFDKATKTDHVHRIALSGGEVESLYSRERKDVEELFALSGFKGAVSDGSYVYVADGGKRSVLSVNLTTKEMKVLAKGVTLVDGVALADGPAPEPKDDFERRFPRVANRPGGGHVVLLYGPPDGITRAAPDGLFSAFGLTLSASGGKIGARVDVAHVPGSVSEVTGDENCLYASGAEADQSVLLAFPIKAPKK